MTGGRRVAGIGVVVEGNFIVPRVDGSVPNVTCGQILTVGAVGVNKLHIVAVESGGGIVGCIVGQLPVPSQGPGVLV